MPSQSIRRSTQNVRDFTVQIRHSHTHQIVGTGFIVSRSGQIVTCAHVVLTAGIQPRTGRPVPSFWTILRGIEQAGSGDVEVYIPGRLPRVAQSCRARLSACFPEYDDDVVLLQLVGEYKPLSEDQVAVLGDCDGSDGNAFRSYGYRRLDAYIAGLADGKILGTVEAPVGRELQAEPVQLESDGVNRGMSGAAVLDLDRNLVVGAISETWFPDESMKDQRTAWAVNARVLSLKPLGVALSKEPPESAPVPEPQALAFSQPGLGWAGVPPAPEGWVDREDMIARLTEEWNEAAVKLTCIIGFGGAGKSSLVRRWLDVARPESVFWWTFSDSNVDGFFETALRHLAGATSIPDRADRALLLAAVLNTSRHVLVLDGLEALQFQGGDYNDLLKNQDLARFLRYSGSPNHSSFCVLTSRLPIADIIDLPTSSSHNLPGLAAPDGRMLLRTMGIKGSDAMLERAAERWSGHALTLRLLGVFLRERFGGDITSAGAKTLTDLPKDQQVERILAFYDRGLDQRQREVLWTLSLFRIQPPPEALAMVLRAPVDGLRAVVDDLARSQLLQLDPSGTCWLHPLVRSHYVPEGPSAPALHFSIAHYYMSTASVENANPSLRQLSPLIEAVHHLCCAGRKVDAHNIFEQALMQGERRYLVYELQATETVLDLTREIYFPDGDVSQDPEPQSPQLRSFVLGRAGNCLLTLGRLREAAGLFKRATTVGLSIGDWHNSSIDYRNLTNVWCSLGELTAAGETAAQAVDLSGRAHNAFDERTSLVWQGWVQHLQGHLAAATDLFQRAEELQRRIDPDQAFLVQLRGIQHAIHLRRIGEHERALRITHENLRYLIAANHLDNVSRCYAVLGDLAADSDDFNDAERHYAEAIRFAREIAGTEALLRALASRSAWAAQMGSLDRALQDITDALELVGEFRLLEADLHAASAVAYHRAGRREVALSHARRALDICDQTGYFWTRAAVKDLLTSAVR